MSVLLPRCCTFHTSAGPAQWMYAAYNRGGDINTAGKNYEGKDCPLWSELPENVRAKWQAAADVAFKVFGAGKIPPAGGF